MEAEHLYFRSVIEAVDFSLAMVTYGSLGDNRELRNYIS